MIDPLDIAYLALGAKTALEARLELVELRGGGEMEYIGEVIQYAPLLERIYREIEDEWIGVWAYDVCEPVGEIIGARLLAGEPVAEQDVDIVVRAAINAVMQEVLH